MRLRNTADMIPVYFMNTVARRHKSKVENTILHTKDNLLNKFFTYNNTSEWVVLLLNNLLINR